MKSIFPEFKRNVAAQSGDNSVDNQKNFTNVGIFKIMLENEAEILFESKNALEKALRCAKQSNTSLVVRKTDGKLWVVDFLVKVAVQKYIKDFLHDYAFISIPISPNSNSASLGSLIVSAGSLLGAIKKIRLAEETAYKLRLNEISDYLANIQLCLQLVRQAVYKSKKISSVQPFCSLCWRLKSEYLLLNFNDHLNHSTKYCHEHHSKNNYHQYHAAKGALISAAKKRNSTLDQELLVRINEKKNNFKSTEHLLYQLSMSFIKKPSIKDLKKLKKPVLKWQDRATQLIELIKNNYPITNKLINNVKLSEHSSWPSWFLEIIKSLDRTETDLASWKDTKDLDPEALQKTSQSDFYDNSLIGWRVLRTICHRHEAFKIFNMKKRPRGPKKGFVKKNDSLRLKLTKVVQSKNKNNKKIVWSHIASELNISPQRLHVLAKEMGLK